MAVQEFEDLARRGVERHGDDGGFGDVSQSREAVDTSAGGLVHDADRLAVAVDDDDRAMCSLVHEVEGVGHRVAAGEDQRRVPDGVAGLHPGDDFGHRGRVDVLRKHDEPAAASDGLGHPPPGDGRHVGHHQGDRGTSAVHSGQVDAEAGFHVRTVRQQEHVVVGQVVSGHVPIQKAHESPGYVACARDANPAWHVGQWPGGQP